MRIKLSKLAAAPDAKFPTAESNQWIAGQENPEFSPPVDYWVEGDLIGLIEVGKSLELFRKIRNGVECDGFFGTSAIQKIEGDLIYTNNSIYKMEKSILVTRWKAPGVQALVLDGSEDSTRDEAYEYFQNDWENVFATEEMMDLKTFRNLPEFEG